MRQLLLFLLLCLLPTNVALSQDMTREVEADTMRWPVPHPDASWQLEYLPHNNANHNVYVYKDKLYDGLFTRTLGWNGGDGVRQLYDKIKELSGNDVIIVFANATKRNNADYTSTSRNTAGCTLADYELAMLTCAAANTNWYFVDQHRLSGITDENLTAVTADGLHLNNLGYSMAVLPWIDVLRTLADK